LRSSPASTAAGATLPRNYTAEEEVRLVEQTMQPGMTVSAVARLHGVSPSLLFQWRRRMAEGGQEAVRADEDVVPISRVRELESRVRELERLLGRKTMETEILREALEQAHQKTGVALAVAATGRFPVKAAADTIGVARSNLVEQLRRPERPPRGPYRRAEDEAVLAETRAITDARPTYGWALPPSSRLSGLMGATPLSMKECGAKAFRELASNRCSMCGGLSNVTRARRAPRQTGNPSPESRPCPST
jgi:transposase